MNLTATGKEQALADFYKQLKADHAARPDVFPANASELAHMAHVGRANLARILSGNCTGGAFGKSTGLHTWKHILPHLSVQALFHLKQCSAWNIHAERALAEMLADSAAKTAA